MCMLRNYVDQLHDSGYRVSYIKEQIAKVAGVRSVRSVDSWLNADCEPNASKAVTIAGWFAKKLGKEVRVEDIWPIATN